jgi:hypothetical protein
LSIRNWYSPVSSSVIVVSVAVMLVTSVVCRESVGLLTQRVRQARSETECDARVTLGNCSQHSLVRKLRPAPDIRSSAPSSRTVVDPPGNSRAEGRGPQALPQSPMFQRSVSGAAFHVPASVGLPSARLRPEHKQRIAHAHVTATRARRRGNARRFTKRAG